MKLGKFTSGMGAPIVVAELVEAFLAAGLIRFEVTWDGLTVKVHEAGSPRTVVQTELAVEAAGK